MSGRRLSSLMGKSNPTFRNVLEEFCEDLEPFRRASYRRYQPAFDRALEHAREHSASAGQVNHPDPELLALFSMVVGLQHEVLELREALDVEPGDQ